jgi:hypothetical protein
MAGIGGRTRPMFNLTISNVPGPEKPLYFRGARLEGAYPVSLITHGQALNITCQSYDGKLAFGITGCRNTLPHMQRLSGYMALAMEELEETFFGAAPVVRKRAARAKPTSSEAVEPAKKSPRRAPRKKPQS